MYRVEQKQRDSPRHHSPPLSLLVYNRVLSWGPSVCHLSFSPCNIFHNFTIHLSISTAAWVTQSSTFPANQTLPSHPPPSPTVYLKLNPGSLKTSYNSDKTTFLLVATKSTLSKVAHSQLIAPQSPLSPG